MSADFIEDAMDSLNAEDHPHFLFAVHPTNPSVTYTSVNISNLARLAWFRRKINIKLDQIEASLKK